MSDVKRYDPMGYMAETPYGDYVSLNDYDQLKAEVALRQDDLIAKNKLLDSVVAENDRLKHRLDAAMELLEASKSLMTIDEWIERNKE